MTTIQRTNAVLNPRAAFDVAGWNSYNDYVVRVEGAPVELPSGTTTAFAVPGYPTGLPAISDHWALPADVEAGSDYLYASCYAYVDGVEPHEVSFWASLKFFDAEDNEISWMAFAHDEIAPLTKFERFVGLIKVPEDAVTFHVFIKTDLLIPNTEPKPDLYFTQVQVENAYGRARMPWAYADGDSEGWSWFAAPHISHSLCDVTSSETIMEPAETTVAIPAGAWLTLPPMTKDLFVGVTYGAPTCFYSCYCIIGEVIFDPYWGNIDWGDPFTATWEAGVGYELSDVLLDGVSIGTPTEKVWAAFTENHTIEAQSVGIVREVSYLSSAHGSISGTVTQNLTYDGEPSSAVTAVPDEGYVFVAWSDGYKKATRTDKDLLENTALTATFALAPATTVTLTYSAGANGSLTGDLEQVIPIGGSGSAVTAIPDDGYSFVNWDDDYSDAERIDVNVVADITVEAQFAEGTLYVVNWMGGDHGMVKSEGSSLLQHMLTSILPAGVDATAVTAVADAGWRFSRWDDDVMTAQRIDRNILAAATHTALYVEDAEESAYTLTYSAGAGGSISGIASQTVDPGGNGTRITAVPAAGYIFDSWSDDYPAPSRVATNVHDDLSVTASFVLKGHVVAYYTCRHGTLTGTARQNVAHGSSGSEVTAVPKSGYHFTKWSDGVLTASRTETNVVADKYVWARYARGNPS